MMCQVKKCTAPLNTVNDFLSDAVTGVFKRTHTTDSYGTQMCPLPLE